MWNYKTSIKRKKTKTENKIKNETGNNFKPVLNSQPNRKKMETGIQNWNQNWHFLNRFQVLVNIISRN